MKRQREEEKKGLAIHIASDKKSKRSSIHPRAVATERPKGGGGAVPYHKHVSRRKKKGREILLKKGRHFRRRGKNLISKKKEKE